MLDFDEFRSPIQRTQSIQAEDWRDFYPDAQEPIPTNAPQPLGLAVSTSAYVDADHARDKRTRRSHTGIVPYV